jgi:hypothetical protein
MISEKESLSNSNSAFQMDWIGEQRKSVRSADDEAYYLCQKEPFFPTISTEKEWKHPNASTHAYADNGKEYLNSVLRVQIIS